MAKKELRTFKDIQDAIIEELKLQPSDTTNLNRIKRDINIVYLQEILPSEEWYWAKKETKVIHRKYTSHTVNATNGSVNIVFSSAPASSQKNKLIKIGDSPELYKIASHTAASTSASLTSEFTGQSNAAASATIWNDGENLPTDLFETCKVWHDHYNDDMEALPARDFLELRLNAPGYEGRPRYYKITEYQTYNETSDVTGLPASVSRASNDHVRTIVFASDVSSLLDVGDEVIWSGAADSSYNVESTILSVSTTTVKYVTESKLTEGTTADVGISLVKKESDKSEQVRRKIDFYPYLNTEDTTINIEYKKRFESLDEDLEEPAIPFEYRAVLLYGALQRAWSRFRNPEEANKNAIMYERMLNMMKGKIQDSTDIPQLKMSNLYLSGKRAKRPRSKWRNF